MDNLEYPRSLNRPTYLIWRFTHKDVALLFGILIAVLTPAGIFDNYPKSTGIAIWAVFVMYRGAIIALKPRGWERHVWQSLWKSRQFTCGHTYRRIQILPHIKKSNPSFWRRLLAR